MKPCAACGLPFSDPGFGKRARPRKYCVTCTSAVKSGWPPGHTEEYRVSRRAPRITKPCGFCGTEFAGTGRERYCSKLCQRREWNRRRHLRIKLRVRTAADKARDDRKNDRRRARQYAIPHEPISRRAVYERDGWTCQLCRGPVARSSRAPNPWAPSLDHIVPISRGGHHVYANVQTAHLRCNVSKGAR